MGVKLTETAEGKKAVIFNSLSPIYGVLIALCFIVIGYYIVTAAVFPLNAAAIILLVLAIDLMIALLFGKITIKANKKGTIFDVSVPSPIAFLNRKEHVESKLKAIRLSRGFKQWYYGHGNYLASLEFENNEKIDLYSKAFTFSLYTVRACFEIKKHEAKQLADYFKVPLTEG